MVPFFSGCSKSENVFVSHIKAKISKKNLIHLWLWMWNIELIQRFYRISWKYSGIILLHMQKQRNNLGHSFKNLRIKITRNKTSQLKTRIIPTNCFLFQYSVQHIVQRAIFVKCIKLNEHRSRAVFYSSCTHLQLWHIELESKYS